MLSNLVGEIGLSQAHPPVKFGRKKMEPARCSALGAPVISMADLVLREAS